MIKDGEYFRFDGNLYANSKEYKKQAARTGARRCQPRRPRLIGLRRTFVDGAFERDGGEAWGSGGATASWRARVARVSASHRPP